MFNQYKRQQVKQTGFAMVAPFWVDNDARYGHVFYHIYDATDDDNMERTREILKLAEKDAIEHGGVSEVDPSWVLIVTWTDMVPRVWYNANADHVCIVGLLSDCDEE